MLEEDKCGGGVSEAAAKNQAARHFHRQTPNPTERRAECGGVKAKHQNEDIQIVNPVSTSHSISIAPVVFDSITIRVFST
jgi:hypothetical protein